MEDHLRRALPLLAFFSGTCGIAYEVLYTQLLTSYFGDVFYVTAVILAMFFLGIAVGSFVGARTARMLPYVEITIGIYGMLLAFLLHTYGLRLTEYIVSSSYNESTTLITAIIGILALPTILIGISVPAFARYLHDFGRTAQQDFTYTYGLYNIGAALSVIGVEYILIRMMGITSTVYIIASINVLIGCALFVLRREFTRLPETPFIPRTILIALFAISIASGIAQLLLFNIAQQVIGPLNENLSLLIGASLAALTFASWIVMRRAPSLRDMAFAAGVVLMTVFLALPLFIMVYGFLFSTLSFSYIGMIIARLTFVLLFTLPLMTAFGLSIPVLTRLHGGSLAGKLLGVSALGNAIGYLMYLLFFYEVANPVTIMGLLCMALLGTSFLLGTRGVRILCAYVALLLALMSAALWWPSYVGIVPYSAIHDREYISYMRNTIQAVTEYRKYGNSTIVAQKTNGEQLLLLNGYHTLTFDLELKTMLHELLLGVIPAYFNTSRDRALVFGLGSGITATAVADLYYDATIAEINPAMLNAAKKLTHLNDFLFDKKNVNVVIQDGLITLLQSTTTYDAIINTVTTPSYFSANKLWTRDVFLEVEKRLSPGGVFAGWIDVRLGNGGEAIMEKTLRSVFDECLLGYLNRGYFAFVCGNGSLSLVPLSANELPKKYVSTLQFRGWNDAPQDFLPQLLFRSSQDVGSAEGINTLDRPLLRYRYLLDETAHNGNPLQPILTLLAYDPFTPDKKRDPRQCKALRMVASGFLESCPTIIDESPIVPRNRE